MTGPSTAKKIAPAEDVGTPLLTATPPAGFRQQVGHISRHSSIFFTGTIFTAAAGYLFKIYLARVLGAEALGIYALGMTMVGFVGVFNALGLPQAAVRFVATYAGTGKADLLRGFLGRSSVLLLVSNVLLGMGMMLAGPWIAVHFYHTPALSAYLALFVLVMLFAAFNAFFGQVLAGYKDIARRTVITSFIGSPLNMAFTLALVGMGLGLRGYIAAQVAGAVLVLLMLVATVWKLTPAAARSFSEKWPPLERQVISFSAAVFGMTFLEFLMAQADKILIGYYLSARQVGIYAISATLVAFVPIILQSVNQIFAPTIADLHARGERELLGRIFQTLTKWILGLTVPLAGVMIIFAPGLMRIFGHEFEAGWPILVIGTAGQLVNCAVGSVGYLLLMSGEQRRLIRVQALMAVVMVLLSLLLIPRWGIIGAAAGAAITNAVSNFLCLGQVRQALGLSPYNRSYVRLLVPVMVTVGVLLGLRFGLSTIRPEWVVIGAGVALGYLAFIGVALAFGLNADDRLIAEAVWSRARGIFLTTEARA
jgi:O-antigen/teichoic acid export membrane protein